MPKTPTKYPLIKITDKKGSKYLFVEIETEDWRFYQALVLTHQELVALREALNDKI